MAPTQRKSRHGRGHSGRSDSEDDSTLVTPIVPINFAHSGARGGSHSRDCSSGSTASAHEDPDRGISDDPDATPKPNRLTGRQLPRRGANTDYRASKSTVANKDSDNEEPVKGRRRDIIQMKVQLQADVFQADDASTSDPIGGNVVVDPASPIERFKARYGTLLQILQADMPFTPPIYARDRVFETKKTTNAERGFDCDKQLKYLVYFPGLLAEVEEEFSIPVLSKITVDWSNPEHIMFAAHCVPEVSYPLLPRMVWTENDVVVWCNQTIHRPALAAYRVVTRQNSSTAISLFNEPANPSLSSALSSDIIPDVLVLKGFKLGPEGRYTQEVLFTIEIKTHNVWTEDLFDVIMQMPPDHVKGSHTMRFAWPLPNTAVKEKIDRIIIQVWSHLIKTGVKGGSLSSHQRTAYVMKGDDETMYISRSYLHKEAPAFHTFSAFVIAAGLFKPELPKPDTSRWEKAFFNQYVKNTRSLIELGRPGSKRMASDLSRCQYARIGFRNWAVPLAVWTPS